MISNWLAATLARRNIHYGWVMVGVTFLTALISAGTVGAPGVFIVPLQKEFGWTTAEISSALSIRFILFGLSKSAREVLQLSRLLKIFEVYETEEEALAS